MEQQKLPNTTGILILGVLSILTCCCYGVIGLPLGIAGLVMANKAKKVYNLSPESYTGYSNVSTGRILSIIGIILNVLFIVFIIVMISYIGWDALGNPELMQERIQELESQQ